MSRRKRLSMELHEARQGSATRQRQYINDGDWEGAHQELALLVELESLIREAHRERGRHGTRILIGTIAVLAVALWLGALWLSFQN